MQLPHRWECVLRNFGEYIEGLRKYELCRCAVSKVTAALPKVKFQPSYVCMCVSVTYLKHLTRGGQVQERRISLLGPLDALR